MEWLMMLGAGAYLTVRLRFVQFRLLPETLKSLRDSRKKTMEAGAVSPFQAVCTALAGTMGTGNIAGVAGAVALGGPGAVFWMWMAALLGMATKYTEVVLAMRYRQRNAQGEWTGGPMFVIEKGLGRRFRPLAQLFCVFGMLSSLGVGSAAQVNTLAESAMALGGTPLRMLAGLLAAWTAGSMMRGGMKRMAGAAEKMIPWVSAVYVTGMLCVIAGKLPYVPEVLKMIVVGAFSPQAAGGALAGMGLRQALRVGVARGVFTHEAGMGSSPIAHAGAQTDSPVRQGMLGIFEVFADTIVLCTLTALGILLSGCHVPYGKDAGAEVTTAALASVFGMSVSRLLIALCVACYALSALAAWSFYGLRCAQYLGGKSVQTVYCAAFVASAFLGAVLDMGFVWQASDVLNILMALPNLLAVVCLSGEAAQMTKNHLQIRKKPEKDA